MQWLSKRLTISENIYVYSKTCFILDGHEIKLNDSKIMELELLYNSKNSTYLFLHCTFENKIRKKFENQKTVTFFFVLFKLIRPMK